MTDALYHELILDVYHHPLNKKKLTSSVLRHKEHNPLCGDTIEVCFKINKGKVAEVSWDGEGCAISQAATSLLTDNIKSKSVKAVQKMAAKDMLKLLGLKELNPARLRCATLGLEAVKKCLK